MVMITPVLPGVILTVNDIANAACSGQQARNKYFSNAIVINANAS
jgi:hypothetical protein